ncbi:uncharacterized protein UTRI_03536 [Ustilago trichophora]|uniref:Oxidoreductase AflY n=1 Tax=Ustilago trichophora TaxID=86804 RepID=A0A5C3E1B7_9BASI|nr:uncharacterized protein UTRI_03536 [Ustilago trichophora]
MTATATPSTSSPSCISTFPEFDKLTRPESSQALSALLDDNHAKHHCFFNTRGMHNHSAHQLIAALTLGASPETLSKHYSYQIDHYLGEFNLNDRNKYDPYVSSETTADRGGKPIEKISENNWTQHLGNARYYWSYLHFFDSLLVDANQKTIERVLEKYVFSKEANDQGGNGKGGMLARFYGGVLHSLIHVGYGLELRDTRLMAEGLAMATATSASHGWLFDDDWLFKVVPEDGGKGKLGLLQLVKELQHDPRLSVDNLKLREQESSLPDEPFEKPGAPGYGVIQEYVDRWSAIGVEAKVNEKQALTELAVFSALLLGAVPKQKDGIAYRHDFFLMHLNNAHLFTSQYLDVLPSHLHLAFLRGLVSQFFYYYISRGLPPFQLIHFTHQQTTTTSSSTDAISWQDCFQTARESVDEHLPKAVRSLYVYHKRYGPSVSSHVSTLEDENSGDWEKGDIFKLTAKQLVQMHKGQLQKSKYDSLEARGKGESVGAHQEFWSFEPFF